MNMSMVKMIVFLLICNGNTNNSGNAANVSPHMFPDRQSCERVMRSTYGKPRCINTTVLVRK